MLWAWSLASCCSNAAESLRTINIGGLERTYLLHTPPMLSSRQSLPLVIMLHGGGGNAANAETESGWSKKADQVGFCVAYPNAMPADATKPASFRGNPQTWNDGSGRFKKSAGEPDDAAFIGSMIDDIASRRPIDTQRVYVTGFSNGASMTFVVGAALSDRIAAMAPVAGACWSQDVTLKRAVPMHYITGSEDPLNPLNGGPLRWGLGGKDKPAVQDSVIKWVKACGLPTTPMATRNENGVRAHRYAAAGTSVEVLYTIIEGHGHIWPGGQTKLPGALVGKAMDSCQAVDVLWSFFATHRLDSSAEGSGNTDPKVSGNHGSAPAAALTPGNHTRVVQVDAMRRRYMVHVPPRYAASHATPVVIAYHGGGGNPESMIRLSGLNAKSDEAGFLVVYPYGTGPLENQLLTLNGGGCCGYAMENKIDDVAFTRALLDDLAKVANVDPDRVFATGLSNGGIMSHYVASELSDRIAAIAPVGGPLMIDEPNAKRPVPVMHLHGTADAFAPFAGGYGKGSFGRSKGVTDFRSVEHTIQAWVKRNGCKAEPVVEPLPDKADDGMKVIRKTWTGGREGSEVVLIEIEGGGHTWPGKEPLVNMLGPSTLDISANDLMWDFFQKHPLAKNNPVTLPKTNKPIVIKP